jgi:hypothetical protein
VKKWENPAKQENQEISKYFKVQSAITPRISSDIQRFCYPHTNNSKMEQHRIKQNTKGKKRSKFPY